mmetsp:Transcript_22601/g.30565  ORF Transcript_22601/g.30565 Transcript_22601/m.30565 type:complete len:155 (+) Transcript_22601:28-492(+)
MAAALEVAPEFDVQSIQVSATYAVREQVLWPGRPDMCRLPGDDEALHLGAVRGAEVLGVISVYLPSEPGGRAQFRKFAVEPKLQGQGIGSKLLQGAIAAAAEAGAAALFCHARSHQQGFYERRGLRAVGEPFEKYGAGLYVEMEMCCSEPQQPA